MTTQKVFRLFASYNGWFNGKLFDLLAGEELERYPADKLQEFGGILRQLNHVFVMDLMWLNRFKLSLQGNETIDHCLRELAPPPRSMEQILFLQVRDMHRPRIELDQTIGRFVDLAEDLLEKPIAFETLADRATIERPLWSLLLHLFNHQSLHRGEIIGHAQRVGVDLGPTDILPLTGLIVPEGSSDVPIEDDATAA
jgi:uncharacterized damage-inducible protein DinB